MSQLSIVIPALNESENIATCLLALAPLVERGAQRIVADGGSSDDTVARATGHAERVIVAQRGRASQMNAGAAAASGDVLLFLHADTRLPEHADRLVAEALARRPWGRFDVRIDGGGAAAGLVAWFMNRRSRFTGIATGDQAMFMRRETFERLGGFAPIALMEDIEMSRRLKALGRPACISAPVVTSGRRWVRNGPWRTIWLMWRLRAAYFLGADPAQLAARYRDAR
jgi:rSAM/selenodomain-associated transferase 2